MMSISRVLVRLVYDGGREQSPDDNRNQERKALGGTHVATDHLHPLAYHQATDGPRSRPAKGPSSGDALAGAHLLEPSL
jgi:hypothetical protein